jgi:hypothetical protein
VPAHDLTVNSVVEELQWLGTGREGGFCGRPGSYTVKNDRFGCLGFDFRGNLQWSLAETVGLLRHIRHA